MINTLLGFKQNQTQKFTSGGVRIPVTQVKAGPCVVVQVKTTEKDGYLSLQLGCGFKKESNIKKPVLGHLKKAALKTMPLFLREVRLGQSLGEVKSGSEIKLADVFEPGDIVDVQGVSKGKGFAGVVKRWGFAGGPRTHGQSDRERAPGSVGATTTPGRVLKGKRMAGRMGQDNVTVKNLLVVATDPEKDLLMIKGLVPGSIGGLLLIKKVGEAKKFDPVQLPGQKEEVAEEAKEEEKTA